MDAKVEYRTDADLGGAPEGLDALIVAERIKAGGGVGLFVARDFQRSGSFVQAFQFFSKDIEVLDYPAWDCLPYDRLSPTAGIAAQRMATLTRLAMRKPGDAPVLVVTTVSAAMQRTPPKSVTTQAGFETKVGRDLDIQALERYFAANGYVRASTVSERGEFAVRGGVIDVYPPGFEEPVRLDMFGSELESIRTFDPETQRSTGQMTSVSLAPVSEALLDAAAISRFRTGYLNLFGAPGDDPLYATISEGARRQGMEQWLPLFYETLDSLFDYLPDDAAIFLDNQVETARAERWDLVADAYDARAEAAKAKGQASANRALPPKRLYLDAGDWNQALAGRAVRRFTPFSTGGEDAGGRLGRTFAAERAQDSVNLFEAVAAHAAALKAEGKRVLFASWTEGSSERLATMLADHGLDHIVAVRDWADVQAAPKDLYLRGVLPVEHGFVTDAVAVISETDILGDRLARPRKKRRASNFLAEASALTTGDLVVHLDHGIGRYEGLISIPVGNSPHDCVALTYSGGDKLYVPVENIDVLSRYGSDSEHVSLDKLGGEAWQRRKSKLKERIRAIAGELLKTAAERALRAGSIIEVDGPAYASFVDRFPYEETEDQLRVIEEVLQDLSAGKPMDRLVCGDVGFGKTEVAMRAAFAAAMAGLQVAIIAPTTLLARQHYSNFAERFRDLPLQLGRLSRLVPTAEATKTREGLADGTVDIVIGTHAVLAKSLQFKRLGLVIVDEEQRFGVNHKEQLKALKTDVHMLTLTATPIPRTLQMAMSGLRELSVIQTPPVDRLAVRTYVMPWDPVVLREALLREHYRGGQSFFVVPRITDLTEIEEFLRTDIPEVKFVTAHGQMSPTQVEERMSAFYEKRYDVLLSTTIVESGLDIPSANTLIIHRADRFGLAQLYQLRGRVGRSKTRAYAYLTHEANRVLTETAEKRLKVLGDLDSLGAGFQLASHDLDIRGAGNLVGDEQSGHIKEVGFELYQSMLEEAILEARAGAQGLAKPRGSFSPQITIDAPILIPEDYVPDLSVRMALYRRLFADITDLLRVDPDHDLRDQHLLLNSQIDQARDGGQFAAHLLCQPTQGVGVVAVNLDRNLRPHAREQMVQPVRDGLANGHLCR